VTRGSTLVICLLAPVTWAPPRTDLARWRAALAEDVVDLLAPLPMVRAAIAATAADLALAKSIAWPSMPILEIDRATPRAALEAAAIFAANRSGSDGRPAGAERLGHEGADGVDGRRLASDGVDAEWLAHDGVDAEWLAHDGVDAEWLAHDGVDAEWLAHDGYVQGAGGGPAGTVAATASPDDGGWALLDEGDAADDGEEFFERAAVVLADAPDLPAMLIGKLLRPLTSRAVAIAPAVDGGLLGVATRLPVPDWLPDLDPETGTIAEARAAAPEPSAVVSTPAWHRMRGAVDLARLDPGLDGWETTRTLLST